MLPGMRVTLRQLSLITLGYAGGALSTGWIAPASARGGATGPYTLLDQLARVLVLVENEYVDPTQRSKLVEGAIGGMVAALDPHSSYMNSTDYQLFRSDTEGQFGGIGVEVDLRGDAAIVIAPIEGSPAERAGIRSGDKIVAVDGVDMRGKSSDTLLLKLRGAPGTRVTLTLLREGRAGSLDVKLERAIIHVKSVEAQVLAERVGYLRIKQFQAGTLQEVLAAAAKLRQQAQGEPRGLILDLRNNPGGLVDEAVGVADELLGSGLIYSTRHRGKVVGQAHARPGGSLRSLPLMVLVNEYSASASELLAGALQDNGRGLLLGAPTFGKGSVQSIIDLPGGAGLKLTTLRYYTPSGRAIQAQGLTPDVLVAAAAEAPPRERDIDGHLPAEGPAPSPPRQRVPSAGTAPSQDDPTLGVPREVPRDPRTAQDTALKEAFVRLVTRQP